MDPWHGLRQVTSARIALGRAGGSLPTAAVLDFQLAHARARDAVHAQLDWQKLAVDLGVLGHKTLIVQSAAQDAVMYLKRPDLGRRLAAESRQALTQAAVEGEKPDLAVIVADGLSAMAAQRQAAPLLKVLLPRLADDDWRIAPMVIARRGRVAIQDEIGALLGAKLAMILIGERPGLGSPDSLAAYLVYDPQPGHTDAQRNCVSNIRPQGLPSDTAAETIHYLVTQSRHLQQSGVELKDERPLLDGSEPSAATIE